MGRKRHTPEQIAAALRQLESGIPAVELCRRLGLHENTMSAWKKRYGSLGTPEIRELRQLREENIRLKARRRPRARQDDAAGRDLKKVVKPALRKKVAGYARSRSREYSESGSK